MTFYLKYRSQTLDELDSKAAREILIKVVASHSIPHALLFYGPKGTGKTSAARILAKVVNCEKLKKDVPCGACAQCTSITKGDNLDVIEVDAASHRGIDEIRVLRDAVKLAPAKANKKIYIIDEAHMLTTEASNALLKTLEEPPSHVIFILATTNPEKLLPTIRSRTFGVKFGKAKNDEIIRSLLRVLKGENLNAKKENLELIAKSSDGSFRDAVKLLEQLVVDEVNLNGDISNYLSSKGGRSTLEFIDLLIKKDTRNAVSFIESIASEGINIKDFINETLDILRKELLAKIDIGESEIENIDLDALIKLIEILNNAYLATSGAAIEQVPLEIAVIQWSRNMGDVKTTYEGEGGQKRVSDRKSSDIKSKSKGDGLSKNNSSDSINPAFPDGVNEEVWRQILSEVRPKNASTEALLRAAKPLEYKGNTLTLGVYYTFHKEKLEGQPHRLILEETCSYIFGVPIRVDCRLTQAPLKVQDKNPSAQIADTDSNLTESDSFLTEEQDEDIIKVAKEVFGNR